MASGKSRRSGILGGANSVLWRHACCFRRDGFRFFFFSNEGDPREPVHIHVLKGVGEAKFWIEPPSVAFSANLDPRTLRELLRIVEAERDPIVRAWHEHFG